jgi:ferric-dicitrate binding protein FerR (iron transport regulator)
MVDAISLQHIAYLEGRWRDKGRVEFQQWIQLDPLHPFEYAKMLEIWDATGQLPSTERTLKKTAERSLATAAWHSKNLISDER